MKNAPLKHIGLQFFAEGDAAPDPSPAPEPPAERTYTRAEVDAIIDRRVAKAMKGMPEAEELTAFRTWKQSQQTEKERWDALSSERDAARTELAAAKAQLEQYQREKHLLGRGVPADDVDYYAFKIGKLVTETTDFETAAEQFLKDNPPAGTMRVDTGAPLDGGRPAPTENETMNSLIRGTRK